MLPTKSLLAAILTFVGNCRQTAGFEVTVTMDLPILAAVLLICWIATRRRR